MCLHIMETKTLVGTKEKNILPHTYVFFYLLSPDILDFVTGLHT